MIFLLVRNHSSLLAQSTVLDSLSTEQESLESALTEVKDQISVVKSKLYMKQLISYGLPSSNYLEHTSYFFAYSEEHEQAKWVAHMIPPEIKELGAGRTNDFRIDPLVVTATADSIDYFAYDGSMPEGRRYTSYGYDRGHLAPSADFRWSPEALSESYYYSNMSPQHPKFNREVWADLEGLLRQYVITNNLSLAVVTAPILTDDLPKIAESPNGVSVPRQYVKVAYDATNGRSIAFLMDNEELPNPPSYYALSVDQVEAITGYNYFPYIDESIEATFDKDAWFQELLDGDVTPIKQNTLTMGYFNTTTGKRQAKSNKVITVCGTVVGTRYSRKGHAWLNLDKKYPNQVFSIMIRKEELVNFPFDPVVQYADQQLCFEGKVEQWGDLIVMQVNMPELISLLNRN